MHELIERTLKEASKYFQNFFIHEYLKKSALHFIDPRLKFLMSIIFILLLVSTLSLSKTFVVVISIFAIAIASKLSLSQLIKRAWLFTVFSFVVVLPAVFYDAMYVATFTLRVFAAIVAMQLFVLTTPFSEVCAVLRYFKIPLTLVNSIWLTYRYILLLFSDLLTILLARESRRVSKGSHMDVWRKGGEAVGKFFARSFERAERVEMAMKSRGDVDWSRNWNFGANELLICLITLTVVFWWWIA